MRCRSLMLKIWQYNRNTDSKEKTAGVCLYKVNPPKQILHITDLNFKTYLLLKQYPVVTALECLFGNMPKI